MKNIITICILCISFQLNAQWPPLSVPNLPVSITAGNEHNYDATEDGNAGSVVVWEDDRATDNDIYAQRINNAGTVQWSINGVPIAVVTGHQHGPKIDYSTNGRAVMAWKDDRSGNDDIYAQMIDTLGNVQWTANGVAVCTATGNQNKVQVYCDRSGNTIIAWEDERSGNIDIYVQKLNSAGVAQWTANGVAVCTATNDQEKFDITDDGSYGVIITWQDKRSGTEDIYAQRVDVSGTVMWTANGVAICTATDKQMVPKICEDASGGAYITWEDKRSGTEDIYAQAINSSGVVQWTANGIAVCSATNKQTSPVITKDIYNGSIIAWEDKRSGTEDIYTQKLNSAGTAQWAANGISVSSAADKQVNPTIVAADEWNGAFIAWEDKRSGTEDIYAQIMDGSGTAKATVDGEAVCTATNKQQKPYIDYLNSGEWLVIWQDERNGNKDLYSQGVNSTIMGVLPIHLLSFDARLEGNTVRVEWTTATEQNNDYFTVERSTNGLTFDEIAEVPGAGNSNQPIDYSIYDDSPVLGTTYYRLKQTDFDGKYEYFDIVAVNYSKNNEGTCVLKVYPNPCPGRCAITLENCQENERGEMKVELFDAAGNRIYQNIPYRDSDGSFSFYINTDNNMAPGVYIVRAAAVRESYKKRMIVK